MNRKLFIFALLVFASAISYAGGKKFIMVELHSEKNRLEAAKKLNRDDVYAKISADAEEVKKRTIMDFTEYFKAAPVYYFMDSDRDKVKSGNLQGVLMNADGSKATMQADGGDFYIVSYTTPTVNKMIESGSYQHKFALVVYDGKYNQVDYFYRRSRLSLSKAARKKYYYHSKNYEIEYFPLAREMNQYFKEHK